MTIERFIGLATLGGSAPIVAGKQSFKLSDIAEVTRGYEDPAIFVIRHNGESSL